MKEWIVGRNPVYETLRAGKRHIFRLWVAEGVDRKGRIADILQLCSQKSIKPEWVPRPKLDPVGENHQGVAVQANAYLYSALPDILAAAKKRQEAPLILVLDALQDPQNLGTLLRTAEAVGVHGVLIPLRRTASITPAVVSASAGACEHLAVVQANIAQALAMLKEYGVWVIGLDANPKASPLEAINLDGPLALVVGSEGDGMRALVRKSCDLWLRLPMSGKIESLNAAVAGSVVLYLALQARRDSVSHRG